MARSLIKYGQLPEKRTAFFLCDIQEKFRPALTHFEQILEAAKKLVQASKILNVPLIVTEQNPKGLGKTVSELDISHAHGVYPKTKFSMVVPDVAAELGTLCGGKLDCVVLFGIERFQTSVLTLCGHMQKQNQFFKCKETFAVSMCTIMILRHPRLGVISSCDWQCCEITQWRIREDVAENVQRSFESNPQKSIRQATTEVGMKQSPVHKRMRQFGCFITTSEAVIFQLLGDKEHPSFADIRPLIKAISPYTGLANTSKI
ncbi:hypothetical protein C0J52_12550 [Blattella germanica]|nr:hypothetical protein C0J52_12550 [Blattella germanica]